METRATTTTVTTTITAPGAPAPRGPLLAVAAPSLLRTCCPPPALWPAV